MISGNKGKITSEILTDLTGAVESLCEAITEQIRTDLTFIVEILYKATKIIKKEK